jgi:hypothetical protein
MDLRLSELFSLRGHLVGLARIDDGDDGVLTPAVQPDSVGQVGAPRA